MLPAQCPGIKGTSLINLGWFSELSAQLAAVLRLPTHAVYVLCTVALVMSASL